MRRSIDAFVGLLDELNGGIQRPFFVANITITQCVRNICTPKHAYNESGHQCITTFKDKNKFRNDTVTITTILNNNFGTTILEQQC